MELVIVMLDSVQAIPIIVNTLMSFMNLDMMMNSPHLFSSNDKPMSMNRGNFYFKINPINLI
jgi:hypothetical protein